MDKFNKGMESKVSNAGEAVSKLTEEMGNMDKDESETQNKYSARKLRFW